MISAEAEEVEAPPPHFQKASSQERGPAQLSFKPVCRGFHQTPPNLLPRNAASRAGRAQRRPGTMRSAPRGRGGERRAPGSW